MFNKPHKTDPRTLHAQAIKFKSQTSTFNNLITLYSNSQSTTKTHLFLSYAYKIFHFQISKPTVASYTSLISAFGQTTSSFTLFISMFRQHVVPSQRTFAVVLKSCACIGAYKFGLQVHGSAVKLCTAREMYSGSALVSFYSKRGIFCDARKVFDEMRDRDEVSFAGMIVGLARNSRPLDAMECFGRMMGVGVGSTAYSVSGTVCAAARIMGLEQCRIMHCHSIVTGLDRDLVVGTSLIDGYGKCGLVSDAREVFDELLSCMNVVGWNAMMAGYAQQGDSMLVLTLLRLMKGQGLIPDEYSFLAVLTSLANAGLVDEIGKWLEKMKTDYGLEPEIEHYACLVGALGGAGRFEDAKRVVTTIPFELDSSFWQLLLNTCTTRCSLDMACTFNSRLISPNGDETFSTGSYNENAEVKMAKEGGMEKPAGGKSWVEHQGKTHVFLAGDEPNLRNAEIYRTLEVLITKIQELGYSAAPMSSFESDGMDKKEVARYHSLKLALSFAVMSGIATPPGKPIRIMKNLRICKDCHESFKFFCRVLDREIIVRDVNRYHRFVYGRCSCGDHW